MNVKNFISQTLLLLSAPLHLRVKHINTFTHFLILGLTQKNYEGN